MYYITTATKKIRALKKRIRAVQGGTSASKTIGILQNLVDFAQSDTKPTLTSIVSETLPHLKKGARLDFINIMEQQRYWQQKRWNATDSIYTFETGSKIEFFGADQADKVRGPRRDRLFINEANNVSFEIFDQLELRTNEFAYLDWNPTNEFWFYINVLGKRPDIDHLILNYRDNEAIPPEILRSLLTRKTRKSWWQVYGEGQLGEVEGKIYTGWEIIDEVPHVARLERRWLDFGYSNDPTSIGDIYYYNGGYILDELLYQKGMLNKPIADFLLNQRNPQTLVIADSAEPKSIDEIKLHGVNIIGAEKGPDSVRNGIALVQDQRISVTKRSINTIKEYRNYLWLVDRDGKILNEEDVACENHSMSGIRYALTSIIKKPVFKMPSATPVLKPFYGDREVPY